MQVLKFGGTSVADSNNMKKVVDIVSRAVDRDRTILVLSAISGCTDTLIKIGNLASMRDESYKTEIDTLQEKHHRIIRELLPLEKHEESTEVCDGLFGYLRGIAQGVYLLGELSSASLDAIQGLGELLSTKIMATKLASIGISTKWIDSRDIIRTSPRGGKNVVDTDVTYANVKKMIESNPITSLFVLPGFIASDSQGRMTTLGRGGSDYTASLYAVGCKARILEIWTDVPGMMTANPKIVPSAGTIEHISYRAALELSHFGAKVIYPPTIQPVVTEGIPIYVKDTFDPSAPGTLIENDPPRGKERLIGISNSDNIALLSLEGSGMVGIPGFSSRLFGTLSQNDINIILITQASSVHTMCVAVSEKDAEKAKEAADRCFAYEISLGKLNPLKVEKGFSIVCLVGDDIINQCGTTGRMLAALGKHSISIRATAQGSSERNISVIIKSGDVRPAIQYIHAEFFDKTAQKDINLFIAGYGVVGKALVKMIAENGDSIAARTGKRLHVTGLSNSRRFVIAMDGIDLSRADELLQQGESAADEAYFEALASISLENSVFVDCTASSDIAYKYMNLFRRGYSVVACNKITFSSPYTQYRALKSAALENGAALRYETTVGAALPILESIARSVNSGDEILKVEAVLSGTLNYIFSTYRGGEGGTFAEVVRRAQEAGYTEPDPRLDLSGRDVLRKLLILSREAGVPVDEQDVEIEPILGPEFFGVKQDAFYRLLEEHEADFAARYNEAASKGLRQRYIASLVKDSSSALGYKVKMSLENVPEGHPLFNLCGTDNAAIITTSFYPSPLVIQGAGAGARQTASGVLNDILL
ncbi:MAG: bifunctional aspartate kinase/homoserine dehydrogenase I [Bacteroidetes bacterium]|uniref:Bifunctional aspartate kinase/homoserine dehydrogenase I n=1 Tax=Candidatus Cryptobacteroides intestinigallinarum TaxID=2840767 RepID=A0A9D9HKQ7_9BACT|nr:bifunctional aspartate kinase/homoserine dehydrogenase I [Candidatus Cryptobacteroides intestinigallinarum]